MNRQLLRSLMATALDCWGIFSNVSYIFSDYFCDAFFPANSFSPFCWFGLSCGFLRRGMTAAKATFSLPTPRPLPEPRGHNYLDLDEKNTSRMLKCASFNFGCHHGLFDSSPPQAQRPHLAPLELGYVPFPHAHPAPTPRYPTPIPPVIVF